MPSFVRRLVHSRLILSCFASCLAPSTSFVHVPRYIAIMPVTTRTTRTTTTFVPLLDDVSGKRTRRTLAFLAPDDASSSSSVPGDETTPSNNNKPTKKIKKEEEEEPQQQQQQQLVVVTTPKKATRKKSTTTTKSSTPRKKVVTPEPGSLDPPKGWDTIYSLVEELRADRSAPVDENGSEALPQRDLGLKVFRFQVLIALMLSSQTKDAVVGDAIRALQKHGLTVDNISATSAETLNSLIQKVGFHNNKTKYIKATVEVLRDEYDGDIPSTATDMMKLSGVGPKMAYIVENVAWDKSSGIGVDTHMHRMFNELKWVTSKNPEQTRIQLESWLPRDKWETINLLWVGFGQEVQQFKPKMLGKALDCSRPAEALRLIKRLGLDYKKEAIKAGLEEKLHQVHSTTTTKKINTEE